MSRSVGCEKEEQALRYLQKQGLTLIQKNFAYKTGEIDLILMDQATLVFAEVRYRLSNQYGGSAASVSFAKQQRIRRTAAYYLMTHHKNKPPRCRFDVVAMNGDNSNSLNWIKNAFYGSP